MIPRLLSAGAVALTLAGTSLLGAVGVAQAQQIAPQCQNVQNVYPPGQNRGQGVGASPKNVRPDQTVRARSGCSQFAPGRRVEVGVESEYQVVTFATADAGGDVVVDFAIPTNLANGRHDIVLTDTEVRSNVVRVPFTVNGAAAAPAAAPAASRSRVAGVLPRTGDEAMIPLAVGGTVLIALGAGTVAAARRRREVAPLGL